MRSSSASAFISASAEGSDSNCRRSADSRSAERSSRIASTTGERSEYSLESLAKDCASFGPSLASRAAISSYLLATRSSFSFNADTSIPFRFRTDAKERQGGGFQLRIRGGFLQYSDRPMQQPVDETAGRLGRVEPGL